MVGIHDTIVACITGPGPAAVATIRLSGPDAWGIGRRVFPALPAPPEPRRATVGLLSTGDEAVAVPFPHGASFTGEETLELSLHGSPYGVRALVEACLAAGARLAEPGEFTRRAFMNGRVSLAQAEAIADTIEARTAAQFRAARALAGGDGERTIRQALEQVKSVEAEIEAWVDFEEEVGPLNQGELLRRLGSVRSSVESVRRQSERGALLRRGIRLALIGPPNAGKSTLFNALLGRDRAIVTEIPGTTRDTIEEGLELGGIPFVLIDTAGLRSTDDPVESEGVRRAEAEAARADLCLLCLPPESPAPLTLASLRSQEAPPTWTLRTMADRDPEAPTPVGARAVSALTGDGLEELRSELVARFADHPRELLPPRAIPSLLAAEVALAEATESLRQPLPVDLAVTQLREASNHLAAALGERVDPGLLDEIFGRFCIGK